MGALAKQKQDERYGYPVRVTSPQGDSVSGFFVAESITPDERWVDYIVSNQPDMMQKLNAQSEVKGREFMVCVPVQDTVFLDPPPVGDMPEEINYMDGVMYLNRVKTPLEQLLTAAAGEFAPYNIAARFVPMGGIKIDLECLYTEPTELGKIYIINELKRLGIYRITQTHFNLSHQRFVGKGW